MPGRPSKGQKTGIWKELPQMLSVLRRCVDKCCNSEIGKRWSAVEDSPNKVAKPSPEHGSHILFGELRVCSRVAHRQQTQLHRTLPHLRLPSIYRSQVLKRVCVLHSADLWQLIILLICITHPTNIGSDTLTWQPAALVSEDTKLALPLLTLSRTHVGNCYRSLSSDAYPHCE